MAYKMKGSPMQRNFESAFRKEKVETVEKKPAITRVEMTSTELAKNKITPITNTTYYKNSDGTISTTTKQEQ